MEQTCFVDLYQILGVDPRASFDEIEVSFRNLARQYHPDNLLTADRDRFDQIVEAHATLRDEARRARYHEEHRQHLPPLESHAPNGGGGEAETAADVLEREGLSEADGIGQDLVIQNKILSLLYQRRRKNVGEPGIGNGELEQLTGCPHEHLEFHIWYLREKGWIATGEDGRLAITIEGVDRAATLYRDTVSKRITDQSR